MEDNSRNGRNENSFQGNGHEETERVLKQQDSTTEQHSYD